MQKILLRLAAFNWLITISLTSKSQPFVPPSTYTGTAVNYVRTWEAIAPGQTSSGLQSAPITAVKQTTKYFDGFGRPQQTILKQGSPLGNDVVTAQLYNSLGQEQYQYLPFVSSAAQSGDIANNGTFKSDAFVQQQAFYNTQLQGQPNEISGNYNYSYEETDYEASPLNRVNDSYAAGVNWVGTMGSPTSHKVKTEYLINVGADNVQRWSIASAQGSIPTSGGAYPANSLYKTISVDEQGHQVISFKDTYGQEILRKVQDSTISDNGSGSAHLGWLCTYKVYDDYGNLRFIIPPAVVSQIDGSWGISQTLADELCFRFEFDALNRVVIKKMPGTPSGSGGEVWLAYDVRNRLVMKQDGNLRAGLTSQSGQSQWVVYLYDALDRRVLTGTINSANSLNTMQQQITSQTGSNSSGTLSGVTPTTLLGNLVLSLPSMTGTWQAAQSITLVPGFSSTTSFTAQIVSQSSTPVNNTVVVNNNPIPSGLSLTPLTASFYDSYNWLSTAGASLSASFNATNITSTNINTSYLTSPVYALPLAQSSQLQGMATGTMNTQLGSSAGNLYSLVIYDEWGHPIQTQSNNISGGVDVATRQFDWSGKNINAVLVHQKNGTNVQSHVVATAMNYDVNGRLLSLTKRVSSIVGGIPISTPAATLFTNQYNERSLLQQTTLGNNIETQQFDHNLRGWTLGMNRTFAETAGSSTNYFGYALGYDYGPINSGGAGLGSFANPAFNGNVAGTVWKSKGDNQIRKYDYSYDVPNRLQGADFNQFDGAQFDKSAGIDYSLTKMGYDANGNIQAMNQNAWIIGGSQQIDQLGYHYLNSNNSNRLQYVADNSTYNGSNPSSTLGDFHYTGSKSAASIDYGYDDDGNITSDANRTVSGIVYNYLSLPQTITFSNSKGSMAYLYNASGDKLQKTTVENAGKVTYNGNSITTSITTVTKYIGGFVYQSVSYGNLALASLQTNDQLLFLNDEVGRVRALYSNASNLTTQTGYAFDYFIRDHVGNVRMALTDEQWSDTYPAATLETSSVANEENYYSIKTGDVVQMSPLSWWPAALNTNYPDSNAPYPNPGDAGSGSQSQYMYRLNASTGDQLGLGITLKVMSGDVVSILGKSIWNNTGPVSEPSTLSSITNTLLSAFAGTAPVISSHFGATAATLDGSNTITNSLMTTLGAAQTQANPNTTPNAGINWILFNDQFQAIAMGSSLVSTTGNTVYTHPQSNVAITSNGYLYVFCNNESNADVYFDNLQVLQKRGPILEEDHYYPVGMYMAGISDHAWNKLSNNYRFQGKEIQDKEFSDGTGLTEYDFGTRFYDHQLGRWTTQDPAQQYGSPYVGMGNRWPNGTDPNGQWFGWDDLIVSAVGFAVGYVGYGLETHHWGGKALLEGLTSAAIAEGGYLTLGGGDIGTGQLLTDGGANAWTGAGAMAQTVAGGDGTITAALSFSATYATSDAASLLQHGSQLQNNGWTTYGLIAGYSLMASVQAGYQSSWAQGQIDGNIKGSLPTFLKGAFSNGIGGAISNAGNTALGAYNSSTHSWDLDQIDNGALFAAAGIGFISSFGGQIAHDIVMPNSDNATYLQKVFSNVANGFTQQLLTNWGNGDPASKDLIPGKDAGGWNTLLNSGGGMPNDLLGSFALTGH
jgi:RHS repeat-associated protein